MLSSQAVSLIPVCRVWVQMGVMCAQQPLESELLQRCQQLQSRLSTLKIENEEVGHLHHAYHN